MVLGKELEQLLSGAEGCKYVERIMREQAEAQVQEQIFPEIRPFLNSEYKGCDISINKEGEVEILFDAPEIIWERNEDGGTWTIMNREFYQKINRNLRNLFDEIGGRYGVKILGF